MSILEDPQAAERFASYSTAVTVMEHVEEKEVEVRAQLCILFDAALLELRSATRITVGALDTAEAAGREDIDHEQRRSFHECCLVIELMRHGCTTAFQHYDEGSCALPLIHAAPPPPVDDAWRRLPVMVGFDDSASRSEDYSLAAVKAQLRKVDGGVDAAVYERFLAGVTTAAGVILQAEGEERRRLGVEHSLTRRGLQDIEEHFNDDFRSLVLARLPIEERRAFIQRPIVVDESNQRMQLALDAEAHFVTTATEFQCCRILVDLRHECLIHGAELLRRRREHQSVTLSSTRMRTHGAARFLTWRKWVQRRRNVIKQSSHSLVRQQASQLELLRRYCGTWWCNTVKPIHEQRVHECQHTAFATMHALMLKEVEERQRNQFVAEEATSRDGIEGLFLSERDATSTTVRANAVERLQQNGQALHRLSVLSRWFNVVRRRQLEAKQHWLSRHTEQNTLRCTFRKWVAAPPVLREFNADRYQREATSLMEVEDTGRELLEVLQGEERIMVWQLQEASLLQKCQMIQLNRVHRLQHSNIHQHMRLRWCQWMSCILQHVPARVSWLKHRNTSVVSGRYFCEWARYASKRTEGQRVIALAMNKDQRMTDVLEQEDMTRILITERCERLLLAYRSIADRQDSIPYKLSHMTCNNERQSQRRVWRRWYTACQQRGRTSAFRQRLAVSMAIKNQQIFTKLSFTKWWANMHHSRLAQVNQEEIVVRDSIILEDITTRECDLLSARTGIEHLSKAMTLLHENTLRHLRRTFLPWLRRGARRVHRRHVLPEVLKLEQTSVLRRSWRAWRQLWIYTRLEVMRVEAERRLRRRYFAYFTPKLVRLARVSRARSCLEDAQRAAKVLWREESVMADITLAQGSRLAPIRRNDHSV